MSDLESLLFYIFCLSCSCVLFYLYVYYSKKRSALLFGFLAIMLVSVLAALRGNVGTDFANYEYSFNYIRENGWNFSAYPPRLKFEFGFMWIVKIVSTIFTNQIIWFVIAILFLFFCIKAILEYEKCEKFSVVIAYIYMLVFFYANSYNIARQMLAFSICLYGMKYLFRNNKKYFIYVLLASLIHYSALITISFWFFWNHKENKMISIKLQVAIFGVLACAAVSHKTVFVFLSKIPLFSFLQKYSYVLSDSRGGNRTFILYVLFAIIALLFSSRLKKIDRRNEFYVFLLCINVAIGLAALSNKFIYRVIMYFQMGYITLFPYFPGCFRDTSRPAIKLVLGIVAISCFVLIYYVSGNAEIIPYRFYWEIK